MTGATGFETIAFGPDADTAFERAVKEAAGQDGWGGTIVDAEGFVQINLPARVDTVEFMALAHHLAALGAESVTRPPAVGEFGDDRQRHRYRHARRMWKVWRRLIPSEQRLAVGAAQRLSGGACTCIQLGGGEARRARRRTDVAAGERAYLFFGMSHG